MRPRFTERYFTAVAEASQDVMRILELDGRVEYMNQRSLELLEIETFEPYRGRLWAEMWPEQSRGDLLRAVDEARGGRVGRFTGFCPTAKGRARWWQSVVSPVRDEGGEVVRLLAISRDITQEHRREQRLRLALDRLRVARAAEASYLDYLRGALEVLPAGLAFYDRDDRLVIWNREYVRAGGADEGGVQLRAGMTFAELLREDLAAGRHPDAVGREDEWIAERLAARAEAAAGGREQQLSNGRWYRFEDRRLDDGATVAVAVDITELKAREASARRAAAELAEAKAAAESASQAKSEFLANMSHEIRTPLNGVVAVADLLCRSRLSDKDRELAEIIRASGQTLEHLLSDILDLARIESGALVIERTGFPLGELARGVIGLSRLTADEKGLSLSLSIDQALDGPVEGDPTRVRQILTNLVANAVKFTDEGEVRVRIQALPDGMVRLAVQDSGVGFDPAEKDRLFRRFEQADGSITRRYGGSGLGLAICQHLARLMGGRLDCDSTPGEGSTFWVDLPLAGVKTAGAAAAPAAARGLNAALRILVADDHPTNRTVVDLMLQGVGAVTCCVENGAQAVEAFRRERFDLVLMDMQMPVQDGLSATREIRAWEREVRRPPAPILMLTANTLPEHVAASLEAGADGHVAKPITIERLFTVISEALGGGEDRRRA